MGISPKDMIGSLGLLGFAAIRLIPLTNQLSVSVNQIRGNSDSISRLYKDKFSNPTTVTTFETTDFSNQNLTLDLTNGVVKYQLQTPEIKLPNLCLTNGDKIAIIGKSGSGKSTLIKVLTGLIGLKGGNLSINGNSLKNHNYSILQKLCAYSPQDSFILNENLMENVCFGQKFDEDRLERALKIAMLSDFVSSLPNKANTRIGKNAIQVSGGQAQRIQIARAIYVNRPILVLDEPTSALDAPTALSIIRNVVEAEKGTIVILVTHDPNLLKFVDRTINLDN